MTLTGSRFHDWLRPGPVPPGGDEPRDGETLDALCGHYRIFQFAKGQRYTTDDVLCAWYATQWSPRIERVADLGAGIGSIALMVAWRLPGTHVVTVEIQKESAELTRRSARYNGLENRVRVVDGDLRDPALLANEEAFDLVTASPPYYSEGTTTEPATEQARTARIEQRGNLIDYSEAAMRIIRPGGTFFFVFPTERLTDASNAMRDTGFALVRRRDVVFKKGQDSRLSLLFAMRSEDLPEEFVRRRIPWVAHPLVVRTSEGHFTSDFATVRLSMGLPPGEAPE